VNGNPAEVISDELGVVGRPARCDEVSEDRREGPLGQILLANGRGSC
jgi:hypothetical protein